METKTLKTFALKVILILTCIIFGFSGFNKCDAQSIVGKWNQISSKQFLTPEGSKTHGKSVLETQMSSIGKVIFGGMASFLGLYFGSSCFGSSFNSN